MTRILGGVLILLAAGFVALAALPVSEDEPPPAPPGPRPAKGPVGMNLGEVTYYAPTWVFADAFRSSAPWRSDQGDLTLREDGYPARLHDDQQAWTLMFRGLNGRYPGGRYLCRWEGRGSLQFGGDATRIGHGPGHSTVDVTPGDAGIHITLTDTDPNDPLRAVRLYPPGVDPDDAPTFDPTFLEAAAPFSVLRFMDWQRTNDSDVVTWDQRTRPDAQTQAGPHGVALEWMIELSNTLDADPWFCIPHQADDAYVTAFASMVHATLDPSRTVYLEYSNEVWNGQFSQARWCRKQGLATELDRDAFRAQLRFYAERACGVFDAWDAGFRDRKRTVRVLSTQCANAFTAKEVLGWKRAGARADALAVAPYVGAKLGREGGVGPEPANALCARMQRELETTLGDAIEQSSREARRHGLPLIAYEGGQHLAGVGSRVDDEALTDAFLAANRDPQMATVYDAALETWAQRGGQLFVAYSLSGRASKWGAWGALERGDLIPTADEAPKYHALRRAAQQPHWWGSRE